MTCHHKDGDPTCTAGRSAEALYHKGQNLVDKWGPKDEPTYRVEEVAIVGHHLLLGVTDGAGSQMVLVYADTHAAEALKWRRINTSLDVQTKGAKALSPAPVARFPATPTGWRNAAIFAENYHPENYNDMPT